MQCHTYCSITDHITRAIHILVLPAASMQHFKAPPLSALHPWYSLVKKVPMGRAPLQVSQWAIISTKEHPCHVCSDQERLRTSGL